MEAEFGLSAARAVLAAVAGGLAVLAVPAFADGQTYVSQPLKGTVMAVDRCGPGDYRYASPVVQGLVLPTRVRFSPDGESMFVCSMAVGGVWRIRSYA